MIVHNSHPYFPLFLSPTFQVVENSEDSYSRDNEYVRVKGENDTS